jgi:hypothetical protein
VLYTSDGRDVEMSVASTKAFYAQIAAGLLLASALADAVSGAVRSDSPDQQRLLSALRELPDRMIDVTARREAIAEAAAQFAPSRGTGRSSATARTRSQPEIRIKLSELCYKSIACDATEDKKHIDLSSEPLILVSPPASSARPPTTWQGGGDLPRAQGGPDRRSPPRPTASSRLPRGVDGAGDRSAARVRVVGHGRTCSATRRRWPSTPQARPLWPDRHRTSAAVEPTHGAGSGSILDSVAPSRPPGGAVRRRGTDQRVQRPRGGQCGARLVAVPLRDGRHAARLYQVEFGKIGTPGVVLDDLAAG